MAFLVSSSRSPHGAKRNAGSRISRRSIRATTNSQRRGFGRFGFAQAIRGTAGIDRGAFPAQPADLGIGKSGLAQNFDAVLAEPGRMPVDPRAGPAPAAGNSGEPDLALARM